MNDKLKALIASSLLLGVLLLTSACSSFQIVHAADSATSQARLQKDIVTAIANRQSTIQLKYVGLKNATLKQEIKDILEAAIRSDDYLHYIVKTYKYKAAIKGNSATIDFSFTYWESLAQTAEVRKQVASVIKRILTPGMNDHQRVKTVHDWVVANLAYDTRLVSHSAYDGLVDGSTVCQGYALLTYEMMKQAGVAVQIVEGTSRGRAHTWNLVRIDGKWYHLDTTWNDPIPDAVGKVQYNYYNLTDAQIRVDHKWSLSTGYPAASTDYGQVVSELAKKGGSKASFYRQLHGLMGYAYMEDVYTASSVSELTEQIRAAADNGESELIIRYTKGISVTSDLKKAFNAQSGASRISYTLEDYTRTPANDKLLRIQLHR
ncbi:transglutaminase domain-containing protein [Cohnella cellulosilytica]|uniref:Transglutaminase domain-containing protein n=1 Tax=Cohnella cellulosilytica TaxID=986710 RepID=A0ABW2F964_9BACL